jgi:hypothetical protein
MIDAVEAVMRHWGEQVLKAGSAGGLPSTMATIMEYGGCAPSGGSYGARVLLAGAGPDYLAGEVEAALGCVERAEDGAALMALAMARYLHASDMSLDEQVRHLGMGRGSAGRSAYYRSLDRLHQLVGTELRARQRRGKARAKESMRVGDRMRKASLEQAKSAHRARGVELGGANVNDRSSGHKASMGAGQVPKGAEAT